jgi:hypothetical protein
MTEEQLELKSKALAEIEALVAQAATTEPREVVHLAAKAGEVNLYYALFVDDDTTDLLIAGRPLFDARNKYLNRHK